MSISNDRHYPSSQKKRGYPQIIRYKKEKPLLPKEWQLITTTVSKLFFNKSLVRTMLCGLDNLRTNTMISIKTAFSRRSLLPNRIPAVTAILTKITTTSNTRIIHNLQLYLRLQLWIAVIDLLEHKC